MLIHTQAYTVLEHRDVALKFVPFFQEQTLLKTIVCLWEGICDIVFENQSVSLSGS